MNDRTLQFTNELWELLHKYKATLELKEIVIVGTKHSYFTMKVTSKMQYDHELQKPIEPIEYDLGKCYGYY